MKPGILIAKVIDKKGLTKVEVCKRMGIHPPNLSEIISGKRKISTGLAILFQRVLDINATYLLTLQNSINLEEAREKLLL